MTIRIVTTAVGILLVLGLLHAQETGKHWLAGLQLSPDLGYRTLVAGVNDSSAQKIKQIRDQNETMWLGSSFGAVLRYQKNKSHGFEAGMHIGRRGYQRPFNTPGLYEDQINPSRPFTHGTVEPTNGIIVSSITRYTTIEIPLRYVFSRGKGPLKFTASIGLTPQWLTAISHIAEYQTPDGKQKKSSERESMDSYSQLHLMPSISSGLSYHLNDRFVLRAEPTFRYTLRPLKPSPLEGYLWNVGLLCSAFYRL